MYYINTALSADPQIPVCQSMLGSNPGLRLWHWQSDARSHPAKKGITAADKFSLF
jgi:hypothetical protein